MLQAVQFPTSIANLTTGLANVDRDALTHFVYLSSDDRDFEVLLGGKKFGVDDAESLA